MKHIIFTPIQRYYSFQLFRNFHFFSAVLVPFYTDWAGYPLYVVTLLQAWFAFWMFILEIPTGIVADKYGRRFSMILGSFVSIVGLFLYSTSPHIGIFLLAEFLLALAVALMSGADEAWLYETLKLSGANSQMQKINGRSRSITFTGMMISAVLGSQIAKVTSLNMPIFYSGFSAILATLILFTLPVIKSKQKSIAQETEASLLSGIRFLYTSQKLKGLTANLVGLSVAAYFVIWLYQPLLTSINISIEYFGWFHSVILIGEIIVLMSLSKLEQLFGFHQFLRLSAILTGLAFVVVGFLPNVYTAAFFVFTAGGLGLSRLDFAKGYIHDHLPDEIRATIGSSISFYKRLSIAIANIIIGFAATYSLPYTLVTLGFLAILVSFIPTQFNGE